MADRQLLSIDLLRQLLDYNSSTGQLFWRVRGREHFSTQRAFKTWNSRFAGVEALTADSGWGYKAGTINGRRYRAHIIAWATTHGEWPSGEIDHINGSRSDNRLCNLREATTSQNQMNRGVQISNTSGFKGVSWHRNAKKWQSRIKVDGIQATLGYFDTPEEAHAAYCAAADRLHGEFARTE